MLLLASYKISNNNNNEVREQIYFDLILMIGIWAGILLAAEDFLKRTTQLLPCLACIIILLLFIATPQSDCGDFAT